MSQGRQGKVIKSGSSLLGPTSNSSKNGKTGQIYSRKILQSTNEEFDGNADDQSLIETSSLKAEEGS